MPIAGTHHAADSDIWMSVAEASGQCGLSEDTVRRRILSGDIPVRALRMGVTIRIDRAEWDRWLTGCLINVAVAPVPV